MPDEILPSDIPDAEIINGLAEAVTLHGATPDQAVAATLAHLFSWGWEPSSFEDGEPKGPYDCRYCGRELMNHLGCAPGCPNRLLLTLSWEAEIRAGWRSPQGGWVGGYHGPQLPRWERKPVADTDD